MAVYRIKELKDGTVRVWARYTPFKGGATQSRILVGPRQDTGKMALQAAEWVAKQRRPPTLRQDGVNKPEMGGAG